MLKYSLNRVMENTYFKKKIVNEIIKNSEKNIDK